MASACLLPDVDVVDSRGDGGTTASGIGSGGGMGALSFGGGHSDAGTSGARAGAGGTSAEGGRASALGGLGAVSGGANGTGASGDASAGAVNYAGGNSGRGGSSGAGGKASGGSGGVNTGGRAAGGANGSGGKTASGGSASGGTPSGGTSTGGTSTGGTSTGGTSTGGKTGSGGASSGGTSSGGTSSGGTSSGGTSSGGTSSGGASTGGNSGGSLTAPSLGSAASFAVFGASTVTCTNLSAVDGDVGVSPGTAITGFNPGCTVSGTLHAGDAVALLAHTSLGVAYNASKALLCEHDLTGVDLGGQTLAPGVYCFNTTVALTGALTLAGGGDSNAVWIFQIGTAITTAANSSVVMAGGGKPGNVFWQVGSSATIATGSAFQGNVLASVSITLVSGSTLVGRALALNGGVTSDHNTVSLP